MKAEFDDLRADCGPLNASYSNLEATHADLRFCHGNHTASEWRCD